MTRQSPIRSGDASPAEATLAMCSGGREGEMGRHGRDERQREGGLPRRDRRRYRENWGGSLDEPLATESI